MITEGLFLPEDDLITSVELLDFGSLTPHFFLSKQSHETATHEKLECRPGLNNAGRSHRGERAFMEMAQREGLGGSLLQRGLVAFSSW